MSEVETIDQNGTLAVPGTGEVVDLTDARQCALALDALRQFENQMRSAKDILSEVIIDQSEREGSPKLIIGGGRVASVKRSKEIHWDLDELDKLRDLGLPENRWKQLVTETVETRVSTTEANRIARANPEYAKVIEQARTDYEKKPYVSIEKD